MRIVNFLAGNEAHLGVRNGDHVIDLALAAPHAPDPIALEACADADALLDGILEMRRVAEEQHGVAATPSFVIAGRTYAGALSPTEIAALVDPLLIGR